MCPLILNIRSTEADEAGIPKSFKAKFESNGPLTEKVFQNAMGHSNIEPLIVFR
jgi:hypothetical protein